MRLTTKNWKVALISFFVAGSIVVLLDTIPWFKGITQQLEQTSLDFRYRNFNRHKKPNKDVVIIDIDEETLNRFADSFGRWPWPRYVYRDLLSYVAEGHPSIILFDILFTEPSRQKSDDEALAETTGQYPVISHAAQFLRETGLENQERIALPREWPSNSSPPWKEAPSVWYHDHLFRSAQWPTLALLRKSHSVHNVGVSPDNDGILRRIPVLTLYDQQWISSLGLRGVLAHWSSSAPEVSYTDSQLHLRTSNKSLERKLPLDSNGQLPLHFYSNYLDFETIRASAILESAIAREKGEWEGLEVTPDFFDKKIVIIGTSAMGLNDLKVTPVGKQIPGVYLHATGISNILDNDFLIAPHPRSALWISLLFILIIYGFLFFTEGLLLRHFSPLVIIGGAFLLALYQFQYHNDHVPMALPFLAAMGALFHGSFYTAIIEARKRKMIETTLSKYLSPTVSQQLVDSGFDPIAEVGQWKEISILFSDIRSFTSLSENISPQFLVQILNDYLGAMTDIIFEHDGTLDKFIGDAVMAFWGAPIEDTAHARKAVLVAMTMIKVVDQFNEQHGRDNYPSLKIGIGVHSGRAVVGNIGSNKRLDYTIIGDNVNLASRLEGLTKEYNVGILISGETYNLIRDDFYCRPIDVVVAKGKTKAIPLFEPLFALSHSEQSSALQNLGDGFTKAYHLYQKGNFQEALGEFESLQRQYPQDGPTRTYIERCQQLIEHPPLQWQGIFIAKTK